MFITCILQQNHIKEVEQKTETKKNVGDQTEKEWRNRDEYQSWANRSIIGQSNEYNFPSRVSVI